jgi:hypothetical protein
VEWNLGWQGVGVLALMSLVFGAMSVVILWHRVSAWAAGIGGTIAFFIAGVLISEAWFGWARVEDLQPNIDGLSFDEVLLIGYPIGIVLLGVIRYLTGQRHQLAH